MTLQGLALRLLRYIGITKFAAQSSGANMDSYEAGDGLDVLIAINGAMQEIFAHGPRFVSHRSFAITLPAPVAVTFTATNGSKVISAATPSSAFVSGATLREAIDNEIVSTTALLVPWGGTSSGSGTAYGDSVLLDSIISAITSPVVLNSNAEPLTGVSSLAELRARAAYWPETQLPANTPRRFLVDSYYGQTDAQLKYRLRVYPMPDVAYTLRFEANIAPPVFVASDLGIDGTDPGKTFDLPNGWDESVLFPIALTRFTASPLFKNKNALAEIARQYREARNILEYHLDPTPAVRPRILTV